MTIDNIVVQLVIENITYESKKTILQDDILRMERSLRTAGHLPISDIWTRQEKEKYITDLRNHRAFYQEILKAMTDAYDESQPYHKGGRHNVGGE